MVRQAQMNNTPRTRHPTCLGECYEGYPLNGQAHDFLPFRSYRVVIVVISMYPMKVVVAADVRQSPISYIAKCDRVE